MFEDSDAGGKGWVSFIGFSQTGDSLMVRISIPLLGLALIGSTAAAGDDKHGKDKTAQNKTAEPYEGFKTDQALLRKQMVHKSNTGGKDTKASSGEACEAAQRIFSRISFLFRTRGEILELLGDPATISDYNQPPGKEPGGPLVYRFDTGFGGLKYTISFGQLDRVRVSRVEVESLN